METLKRIDDKIFLETLRARVTGPRAEYKSFFSTFLGGITTEVHHMIVPLDDHMVHRGDAVFEAAKFFDGATYALKPHLDRMDVSAAAIGLKIPMSRDEMVSVIRATIKASGLDTGIIRLYVARGPGGFTANPYESIGAQVYCAITKSVPPPAVKYEKGVKTGRSEFRVKEGFFANTKSCNYLPNALMKKESVDRGIDYVLSHDEEGYIAEGSTENFALITEMGALQVPSFDRILRGVTILRAMELAKELGIPVENKRFKEADILRARGALMAGTTIDILPVASFEAHVFPSIPNETRALMRAFQDDLKSGPLRSEI